MIINIKATCLTLAAICAVSALLAPVASASLFRSEKEKTILTGEGINHVFKSGSLEVTCKNTTWGGTAVGAGPLGGWITKELTLHPTDFGCSDNIFGGSDEIDTTGCNYVFKSETNATKDLTSEIECTTGYAIKVTMSGCTLTFHPQPLGGGAVVLNEGSASTRDTKFVFTATATFTKSGFSCGLVSGTTGETIGTTTLKGFVDNGVSGWIDEVEGPTPGLDRTTTYSEGAQVGIWWE